jgi:hypothetical protein
MAEPMVTLPAADLAALQARLGALEAAERVRAEIAVPLHLRPDAVDAAMEARRAAVSRPASVRTQEIADKKFGTSAPRWLVKIETMVENTPYGKAPNISEHFPLTLSASNEPEACARYLSTMGITHLAEYHKVVATPATETA